MSPTGLGCDEGEMKDNTEEKASPLIKPSEGRQLPSWPWTPQVIALLIVGAALVMFRGYVFRAHGASWGVELAPATTDKP
jgi:hypothetical protein